MDHSGIKIGSTVLGLSALYFGINGLCTWLVQKTYSEKPTVEYVHMIGTVSHAIEFYSYKSNPKKWNDLEHSEEYDTFDLVPAYYRIINQNNECIILNTSVGDVTCRISPTIDVQLNSCKMVRCSSNTGSDYHGFLNYPIQLFIALQPSQQIVIYGHLESDDVFRINRISNYHVDKYNAILQSRLMWKIGYWLFGITSLSSLAFLFHLYKE